MKYYEQPNNQNSHANSKFSKKMNDRKIINAKSRNGCLNQIVSFYESQLFEVVNSFYRPRYLSLLLVTLQYFQLLSLLFDEASTEQITYNDDFMKWCFVIINKFRGSNMISNFELEQNENINGVKSYEYIVFLSFALQIIIIIFSVLLVFVNKSLNQYFKLFAMKFISILLKFYPYAFHQIIILCNVLAIHYGNSSDVSFSIAIINFFISIIICSFAILHDFNYSFKSKDFLARSDSLYFNFLFLQEIIACILEGFQISGGQWVIVILIIQKLIHSIAFISFRNQLIQKLNIFYSILCLVFWICKTFLESGNSKSSIDSSILIVSLIPFMWQFSSFYYDLKIKNILIEGFHNFIVQKDYQQGEQTVKAQNLDLFCRQISNLIDLDVIDYLKEATGMYFDSIFTQHVSYCTQTKCFCQEFQTIDQSTHLSLFDKETRNQFLCLLIAQTYKSYLIQQSQSQKDACQRLQYSYLYFLIEIMEIPTKSFVEIINSLNQSSNNFLTSLKKMYILQEIYHICQDAFSYFWKQSYIQNQRLDMISVIDFSDLTEEVSQVIKNCLMQKRDILIFLNDDQINLNALINKLWYFLNIQKDLSNKLLKLFDIYPNSKYTINFAHIFTENFDLEKRKVSQFIKQSKNIMKASLKLEDYGINLFNSKSCVVFITLINPIGVIQRVSRSYEDLFGVKQDYYFNLIKILKLEQIYLLRKFIESSKEISLKRSFLYVILYLNIFKLQRAVEVIGKSCNIMMPDAIAQIHDDFLKHFVDRGNIINLKKGVIFGFGKRRNGFMFPINSRIKLQVLNGVDFGANGYFEEGNIDFDYFLCEPQGGILDITEKLFISAFQQQFKSDKSNFLSQYNCYQIYQFKFIIFQYEEKVENFDVCRLIPFVGLMIHKQSYDKQPGHVETIMAIPINATIIPKFKKTKKIDLLHEVGGVLKLFSKFENFKFYSVSLRVEIIDTQIGVSVMFVEFKKVTRIRLEQEMIDKLTELKDLIETQLDICLTVNYKKKSITKQQISFNGIEDEKRSDYENQQSLSMRKQLTKKTSIFQNATEAKIISSNILPLNTEVTPENIIIASPTVRFASASIENNFINSPHLNTADNQDLLLSGRKETSEIGLTERNIGLIENTDRYIDGDNQIDSERNRFNQRYAVSQKDQIQEVQQANGYDYNRSPSSTRMTNNLENATMFTSKEYVKNLNEKQVSFKQISQNVNAQQGDSLSQDVKNVKKLNQKAIKYLESHKKDNYLGTLSLGFNSNDMILLTNALASEGQLSKQNNYTINSSELLSIEDKNYLKQVEVNRIFADQESYKSSTREGKQEKNSIAKEILINKPPKFARYFIQVGQSCSFLSAIIPIIFFLILLNFILKQSFDFKNSLIIYEIITNSNQVVHTIEKVRFYEKGVKSVHINKPLDQEFQGYQEKSFQILEECKKNIYKLSSFKSSENGASFVENTRKQLVTSDSIQTSVSFIVWLQSMLVYGYEYIYFPNNPIHQASIYNNFIEYQDMLLGAFDSSVNDSKASLQSLKNIISYALITSTIVIVISILIIIPISLIVEKKKEEFVKLICTYPADRLEDYLEQTCLSLQHHYIEHGFLFAKSKDDFLIIKRAGMFQGKGKEFIDSIVQTQIGNGNKQQNNQSVIQGQSKRKKRIISQTTTLSSQKIQTILLSSVCFAILIIQPYIQFFKGNQYISEIQQQIELSERFSSLIFQIDYTYSKMFLNINMQIFKNESGFNNSNLLKKYLLDLKGVIELNTNVVGQFQDFQQQINVAFEPDPKEKTIIIGIVFHDTCEYLNNYKDLVGQYINQSYGDDGQYCQDNAAQTPIRRGLVITTQYLFELFNPIYEILNQEDDAKNLIQNYDNQYNLNMISHLSSEFNASISICQNLIIQKIQNLTDSLFIMFYALFSYQMIALIGIYYYLWKKVLQEISKNFYRIKTLFTFFSIDQILHNSYITNYLQDEIRQNQTI